MDLAIVKRHPYATGAVIVFFILVIYLVMKKGSASSSSTDTGGGDAVLATVNSAQSLANAQANAQITGATIQGQVATTQINAQLAAAKDSNATALSIVSVQSARDLGIEASKDNASVMIANSGADAAKQIATTQANAMLGIAGIQADVAKTQIRSINDITTKFGSQKQLGSKIVNVIAAMQGPQAIAANQPTSVATVNAGVAGGPVGFLKALNPAGLLSAFFG